MAPVVCRERFEYNEFGCECQILPDPPKKNKMNFEMGSRNMSDKIDFRSAFHALTGNDPFHWQTALFERFVQGDLPSTCDLPTGLGKTAVIPIWLIALVAAPERSARRLELRFVNRRTVVDQSTAEAEKLQLRLRNSDREDIAHEDGIVLKTLAGDLRKLCAFRDDEVGPLAISTLRGQFADNGEWVRQSGASSVDRWNGRYDRQSPLVQWLQHWLQGQAPARRIPRTGRAAGPRRSTLGAGVPKALGKGRVGTTAGRRCRKLPWPKLRIMALTATARNGKNAPGGDSGTFELTPEERQPPMVLPDPPTLPIHRVWRRLSAKKSLSFHAAKAEKGAVARRIAGLAAEHADQRRNASCFRSDA